MNDFNVILRQQTPKCNKINIPVDVWIKENIILLKEFIGFANNRENAIGLAANQCSLTLNADDRILDPFFGIRKNVKMNQSFELFINPKIIDYHGVSSEKIEGCLTWPQEKITAQRYGSIDCSFCNIDGEFIETTFTGFMAQVFQHEYNHIIGVEEKLLEWYKPIVNSTPKVGRNDPCPCGKQDATGKVLKFKKCCGSF